MPAFAAPQTVAATGIPSLSAAPFAAVNAAGDWAVAWESFGGAAKGLVVRRARRGGSLARSEVVARASPFRTALVVTPEGATGIAWLAAAKGKRAVMVRFARPGRRFGQARRIAAAAGAGDLVSGAAAGRVLVAWSQPADRGRATLVRYAIGDRRGRFGAARTLARADYSTDLGVEPDPAGDLVVSYRTRLATTGSSNAQLAAAVLPRGASAFANPQVISSDTQQSIPGSEAGGELFAGPGGLAAGFSVTGTLPWQLRVATLGGDRFGAPATVGTVDNQTGNHGFYGPVVALPARGAQVVAWAPYDAGCGECEEPKTGSLDAAVPRPDGTYEAPSTLSRAVSEYVQAAATNDLAIVAWGEGKFDRERLRYVLHTADGAFTAPRLLDRRVLRDAALAAAGSTAVIAWISGHVLRAAVMRG